MVFAFIKASFLALIAPKNIVEISKLFILSSLAGSREYIEAENVGY
jgi:hypothetical protein